MLDSIINLLFPPKCMFCRSILDVKNKMDICDFCYKKIPFISYDHFKMDSKSGVINYYDQVICVCEYSGIIKESIIRYKFFDKASYYKAFGKMLSEKVKLLTNSKDFDIILSVPLHKSREVARGYNQSFLISKVLSREIKVPEKSGLLLRVRKTGSQSRLTKEERYSNIKDAFKIYNTDKVKGKKILLVDDILTTGNTINECSRVLKEAGAKKVTVAVIASGRKY